MAHHSQHSEGMAPVFHGGAGQSVVELCRSSERGLVFWSRQRFEIGAELQIRLRRDVLAGAVGQAAAANTDPEWVTVRGFVVECASVRRADGSYGFLVSLLLDQVLVSAETRPAVKRGFPCQHTLLPGLVRTGLN